MSISRYVPVHLQRYDPGSLPKYRERVCTGRSNRRDATLERAVEIGNVFLHSSLAPSADQHAEDANGNNGGSLLGNRQYGLSVGEVLCRSSCGPCSRVSFPPARGSRCLKPTLEEESMLDAKKAPQPRPLSHTLTAHTMGNDAIKPNVMARNEGNDTRGDEAPQVERNKTEESVTTRVFTPLRAAQRRQQLRSFARSVHPAVQSLLLDNERGKGHSKIPENFFVTLKEVEGPPRGNLLCNTVGTLHGVKHVDKEKRAATKLSADAKSIVASYFSQDGTGLRMPFIVASAGGQLEYDDPKVNGNCRNSVVARHCIQHRGNEVHDDGIASITIDGGTTDEVAVTQAKGSYSGLAKFGKADVAPFLGQVQRRHRLEEEKWIASYEPSLQPYNIAPFLGRFGYKDRSLNFHCTQPVPSSDMYASSAEQFRTTKQVPLETPNAWQLRRKTKAHCQ